MDLQVLKPIIFNQTNLLSKIIFMKARPQSTSIANDLKQGLLKRAIAQIWKRQFLFKNMNVYSLGQLSNVIQQVNEQQFMTVTSTCITETDDFSSNPIDNMMSMCDLKMLPTQVSEDDRSQCKSKGNQSGNLKLETKMKHQKIMIIDIDQENKTEREKLIRVTMKKQEQSKDSRQIQAFRTIKQKQYEQRIRNMASQKKNKQQTPINLNNERVMYSYDSKITKLDRFKQRQHQNISQLSSNLIESNQNDEKLKKRYWQLKNSNPATQIRNKVNLTQKQIDQELQRQNKHRKHHIKAGKSAETATPSGIIKVNPESHKQYEQAILVNEPGVKIFIQQKQFSIEKASPRSKFNRRMTRSEYLKVKSSQQIKQIFRNSNASLNNKAKNYPQQGQQTQKTINQNRAKNERENNRKKLYLSPFQLDSLSEKSRIMTHSLEGKAELIKQSKQKPFLFQTIQEGTSKKKQLSNIDKYNLLYVKFKGNPPLQASEQTINELQSQSKVLKSKPSLLTMYSKKSSIKRQNRLIKKAI